MKKTYFGVLIALIILGLISCGNKDKSAKNENQSGTQIESTVQQTESTQPEVVVEQAAEPSKPEPDFPIDTEYNLTEETKEKLMSMIPVAKRYDNLPEKGKAFSFIDKNFRYALMDGEYVITDYFPSLSVIVPEETDTEYCKYILQDGNKRNWEFYVKKDSLVFDAIPAFTCNDAVVYSEPNEEKITDNIIEKFTYVAWLYSTDSKSEFVPIKTFSEGKVSETKYVKKDDIWSRRDDINILYLYKQFKEITQKGTEEQISYYLENFEYALKSSYSRTTLLKRQCKEMFIYSSKHYKKDYDSTYLEFKTTLKQIEKLKEKFPEDKYYYCISTEKYLPTYWTSFGGEKVDNYLDLVKFSCIDFDLIPKETVFAKRKENYRHNISGAWYYDEKSDTYRLVSAFPLDMSDSYEKIALMDQIQNGNKSSEEIKKLFQEIYALPVNLKSNSDINISDYIKKYRNMSYYTVYDEEIHDAEDVEGTFTAVADTPVLSLPGTLGDEVYRFTEDTEIIPVKGCGVMQSAGQDDGWTELFYVYISQNDIEGWVPANKIKAKGSFKYGYYYGSASEYDGYLHEGELERNKFIPYDVIKISDTIDIIDTPKFPDTGYYEYAYSNLGYLLLESWDLNGITVYSDYELTDKLTVLPDYSIVLYGQKCATRFWKGGGDAGIRIESIKVITPELEGWVNPLDVFTQKYFYGYSES